MKIAYSFLTPGFADTQPRATSRSDQVRRRAATLIQMRAAAPFFVAPRHETLCPPKREGREPRNDHSSSEKGSVNVNASIP